MANNTVLNAGSGGDTIQTDDVGGGVKQGVSKIVIGAAGAAGNYVSSTNPFNVDIATIGEAAVAVGHGVAATALRVELPTDGTGQVKVANGQAASGASTAGNPVRIGGNFNTTQPTVTNGQSVDLQATARGAQIIASGVDLVQVNTEGQKATYSASVTGFTPVATPTDFFNIFGSGTKTVRITRIEISGITSAATAAALDLQCIKRSTAGTLNTAVLTNLAAAPHDSNNAAGTAVPSTVGTANYQTLGTIVGTPIRVAKFIMTLSPFTATDFPECMPIAWDFTNRNEQGIVLRGTSQQLALGFNGGTLPAGTSLDISVTWTEE